METIFIDTEKTKEDIAKLDDVLRTVKSLSNQLDSLKIATTKENIINLASKNVVNILNEFKKNEVGKIQSIINQFGETAITDGWETKVEDKVNTLKNNLFGIGV